MTSLGDELENSRVDVLTDNMSVLSVWENQGGRDKSLNDIAKTIFGFVFLKNIDLHMEYVNTKDNVADGPSRAISLGDSMLSEDYWDLVEHAFGPHSTDLMSLDSNAMRSRSGCVLRHFTPYPTPDSAGVNMFSQDLSSEANPYSFPPFAMIFPTLCSLVERNVK